MWTISSLGRRFASAAVSFHARVPISHVPAACSLCGHRLLSGACVVLMVLSQLVPGPTLAASATSNPAAAAPARRPPPTEGVRLVPDLTYVPDNHERHSLDLYLPLGGTNWPLIVWIHGGAWRQGSKDRCPAFFLADDRFAVASINYRLSQHALFPAQIEDAKAAIRWLRAQAAHYGYDPNRIGVWGSSAGGHLAALLGTTGDTREFDVGPHLDVSSRVQAVCDFFGPTDFLRMREMPSVIKHEAPDSPESLLLGGPLREKAELARKANPITYITSNAPPFLIMHGERDRTVPINQSQLLHEALVKAGVKSQLRIMKGVGHSFRQEEAQPIVHEFFHKTFREPAVPSKVGP